MSINSAFQQSDAAMGIQDGVGPLAPTVSMLCAAGSTVRVCSCPFLSPLLPLINPLSHSCRPPACLCFPPARTYFPVYCPTLPCPVVPAFCQCIIVCGEFPCWTPLPSPPTATVTVTGFIAPYSLTPFYCIYDGISCIFILPFQSSKITALVDACIPMSVSLHRMHVGSLRELSLPPL